MFRKPTLSSSFWVLQIFCVEVRIENMILLLGICEISFTVDTFFSVLFLEVLCKVSAMEIC